MKVLRMAILALSISALVTTAAIAVQSSSDSGITITVETDHSSEDDGGWDDEPAPTAEPAGGTDGNGNCYYLKPGIKVSKPVQLNGYMVGKPGHIFDMEGFLTRAEFSVIMNRVFVFENSVTTKHFEDTKGHWAESVISSLAANKIILGVSSTEFNPDGPLTRDQVLQMLSHVLDVSKYSRFTNLTDLKRHYAKETIAQMLNSGIYDKLDSNYDVTAVITRGEMVHLVNNIIYDRGVSNPSTEELMKNRKLFLDLLDKSDNQYYKSCVKSIDTSILK